MVAAFQELQVKLAPRRWSCVIDPALALSPQGLAVVKRLGEFVDTWIPREMWHILDNTHFYLRQPRTLTSIQTREFSSDGPTAFDEQQLVSALREWERLRFNTDLIRLKMFWIGDGLSESFLPQDADADIVFRYESLNDSLDARLPTRSTLDAAFCDTVALSAALPSSFILTLQPSATGTPEICRALETWEIPCKELDESDELVALERHYLRELLVSSGLAGICWAGLRLAVLHLVAPGAHLVPSRAEPDDSFAGELLDDNREVEVSESDFWRGAKAFWYALNR